MIKSPRDPNELFGPERTIGRPVRSDFARQGGRGLSYGVRRFLTLAVLAGAIGSGCVWGWKHLFPSTPGDIPTIHADGSYKQRPDQPGGIDIPNQDVQVYHEIDGGAAAKDKPVIEHMLPPPEEPNAKLAGTMVPVMPPDSNAPPHIEQLNPPPAAKTDGSDPILDSLNPPLATTVSPTVAPTAPVELKAVPSVGNAPAAAPLPSTAPAAPVISAPSLAAPAATGSTILQLAATNDQHAAETMAKALQQKYQAALGAGRLHVVRADLGAKGIFYRIQTQGLPAADARAACAAIKNQHAGCLLVHS